MERKGHELTIKLIAASQPCTASATEDTLAVAQSANVRAGRLTEAILVREGYDPATIAGTDAKDTQRQEALEDVGTGGTSAIERQRDRRALRVGINRTVSLLAGVLGLGVKATSRLAMRFCVAGGLGHSVARQGVRSCRAWSAQRSVPTCVRQACWNVC
jgi:hypothetical protein